MADNGDADKNTENQINFTALKKHDGEVDKIIDTASSVAHYTFDSESETWTKTDMEGSLFVYLRKSKPDVAFFIMNRLSTENCRIFISRDMEFKIEAPFVLCRTSPVEIIGIWFYDQEECTRVGSLLERLVDVIEEPEALKQLLQSTLKQNSAAEKPPVDVLSMFAKATKIYEQKQQQQIANASDRSPQTRPKAEDKGNRNKKGSGASAKSKKPDFKRTTSIPIQSHSAGQETPVHSPSGGDRQTKVTAAFQEHHKRNADQLMNLITGGLRRTRSITLPSDPTFDLDKEGNGPAMLEEKPPLKERTKGKVIDVAELEAKVLQSSPPKLDRSQRTMENGDVDEVTNEEAAKESAKPKDSGEFVNDVISSRASSSASLLTPSSLVAKSSSAAMTISPVGRGRGTLPLYDGQIGRISSESFSLKDTVKARLSSQRKLFPENTAKGALDLKTTDSTSSANSTSLLGPSAFLMTSSKSSASEPANREEKAVPISKELFLDAMIHLMQTDETFVSRLYASYLEICSDSNLN